MKQKMDVGTYSQIETINRRGDLSLFQMEEGILLSYFLVDGVVEFQEHSFI